MANRIYCLLFILLFCRIDYLYSQETAADINSDAKIQKNYFIEEGNEGASIYQHLSWEAVDNILGFEFVLEKQDKSGSWVQIDKKKLKKNSLNVSLKPGKYRYKVAIINLLNQLDSASEYRNFDIRVAYQPEVSSLSVNKIYFDDIDSNSNSVIVLGKNLFSETIFTLSNDKYSVPCTIIETDEAGKE